MANPDQRSAELREKAAAFVESWAGWRDALSSAVGNGVAASSGKPWGQTLAKWGQTGSPIPIDEVALRIAIAELFGR